VIRVDAKKTAGNFKITGQAWCLKPEVVPGVLKWNALRPLGMGQASR
jgi:hypothetical protein